MFPQIFHLLPRDTHYVSSREMIQVIQNFTTIYWILNTYYNTWNHYMEKFVEQWTSLVTNDNQCKSNVTHIG